MRESRRKTCYAEVVNVVPKYYSYHIIIIDKRCLAINLHLTFGGISMDNCSCSARQLAIIANAVAVALTENLTVSQQNALGNLIVQIGSTILSIAATTDLCSEVSSNASSGYKNASKQGAHPPVIG